MRRMDIGGNFDLERFFAAYPHMREAAKTYLHPTSDVRARRTWDADEPLATLIYAWLHASGPFVASIEDCLDEGHMARSVATWRVEVDAALAAAWQAWESRPE